MAKPTVVKKQGPRGPMTEEHKKKIGLALKRKWKARKTERVTALDLSLSQPKMSAQLVGFLDEPAVDPRTLMQVLSEMDLTIAALNKLHKRLSDLIGD